MGQCLRAFLFVLLLGIIVGMAVGLTYCIRETKHRSRKPITTILVGGTIGGFAAIPFGIILAILLR